MEEDDYEVNYLDNKGKGKGKRQIVLSV